MYAEIKKNNMTYKNIDVLTAVLLPTIHVYGRNISA